MPGNSRGGGYNPAYFSRLAAIESRHFWFVSRQRLIREVVRSLSHHLRPGFRVLEVGCGNGSVLEALEQACGTGLVIGMDRFNEGLSFAASRGRKGLVQGDAHTPPFATQFDIVGAFDVLEHLPDDERILRDIHQMIRPGGHLILTVPAYQWLWSEFDELAHHCRRYGRKELHGKLESAGFSSVRVSPFMMSILPLVWLHRKTSSSSGRQADADLTEKEIRIIPVINEILRGILTLETQLVKRGVRLPFGTSLLAVATKV